MSAGNPSQVIRHSQGSSSSMQVRTVHREFYRVQLFDGWCLIIISLLILSGRVGTVLNANPIQQAYLYSNTPAHFRWTNKRAEAYLWA